MSEQILPGDDVMPEYNGAEADEIMKQAREAGDTKDEVVNFTRDPNRSPNRALAIHNEKYHSELGRELTEAVNERRRQAKEAQMKVLPETSFAKSCTGEENALLAEAKANREKYLSIHENLVESGVEAMKFFLDYHRPEWNVIIEKLNTFGGRPIDALVFGDLVRIGNQGSKVVFVRYVGENGVLVVDYHGHLFLVPKEI